MIFLETSLTDIFDKLSDTQSEAGIIATLVYHPEFILHSDYLKAGYFYHKDNGCIYWAINELYKKGVENIDAFNITSMLQSNRGVARQIEKVNMPPMEEYINLCKDAARHTLAEYQLLVVNVVTLSFKRDLYKTLGELQSITVNTDDTLSKLSSKVYGELEKLTGKYIFDNDTLMFGEKVGNLWKEVCERRTGNGLFGIPSKFPRLTKYFSYETGELVMVSGKKKRGKSAFMLNEAIHKIQNGVPTVYFDTEMNDRLFYIRMLSNLTGIEQAKIKSGNFGAEEQELINKTNEWIKKQPFVHKFIPTITNEEIYQTCKILKYKMGLQFVIYDYFKSSERESNTQYNDLGAKCDFLKNNIAGELDLAVLAGAQLNRQDEVADSDKLERYASVSIKWRNKTAEEIQNDGKECGNFALSVMLNRLGEQMFDDEYIDFNFAGSIMRIEEAKRQHSEEEPPF